MENSSDNVNPETYKEAKNDAGKVYYYNILTKKSVWDLPHGAVLLKKKKKEEPRLEINSNHSMSNMPTTPNTSAPSNSYSASTLLNDSMRNTPLQQPTPIMKVSSTEMSPAPSKSMRSPIVESNFNTPLKLDNTLTNPPFLYLSKERENPLTISTPVIPSYGSNAKASNSKSVWIECKEVETGRYLWYNRDNLQIVFDKNPNNTSLIPRGSVMDLSAPPVVPRSANKANNAPIRQIDPDWAQNDDGTWYNKHNMDTRPAENIPYLDQSSKLKVEEEVKYTETPESAADKLLNFGSLNWDFKNPRCEIYRARASRVNHSKFAPSIEALTCPRYFSTMPIPPLLSNTFTMSIKIPDAFVNSKTQIKMTKIVLKLTDTGNSAIDFVLKKCVEGLILDNFVLKMIGRDEYIFGEPKVIDYEFVRYCLRHQSEISLQLVFVQNRNKTKWPLEWLSPSPYVEKYSQIEVMDNDSYRNLALRAGAVKPNNHAAFNDWTLIPAAELKWPYRVKINDISNVSHLPRWTSQFSEIIVKTVLYHGTTQCKGSLLGTRGSSLIETPVFSQWLTVPNLTFNILPRETRVSFLIFGANVDKSQVLLGYVTQNLFDERGCLINGGKAIKVWPMSGKIDKHGKDDILAYLPESATWENISAGNDGCSVCVQFDEFELPVVAPLVPPVIQINEMQVGNKIPANLIAKATMQRLEAIAKYDPLKELTEEEKTLLWTHRHLYTQTPSVLPKFLQCVDWSDKQRQAEAHRLLGIWTQLNQYEALELLDSRFPDTTVRQYAVRCLYSISDSELAELLLQFTQILKYEPYHDSILTRFLIERCLRNPYQLGHFFFWHLKAEMANLEFAERFGLILEEYLKHAGQHAVELQVQNLIVLRLQDIADLIIKYKNVDKLPDDSCKSELRNELSLLNNELPPRFQVSLNPRWVAKRLKPEKCKYMSSKKLPLWLVFENADPNGPDIYAIFKSGDDLRQDILTLQLLRMMDRIWLNEQFDLRLKPYSVIATGVNKDGEGVGMIEVVLNSTTISDVQIKYGGGAAGAMDKTTLNSYIKQYNEVGPKYDESVVNFLRSCAGYCVASYVLGIGDRHNGNIMLTESGHLFHIDFGHFLGNFKKKFGFNRERSPFVFTPEMAFVIGGENYSKSKAYGEFVELCCGAYNSLRKNSNLFISMFVLMQTAGMPELSCFEDIFYLRDMLNLQYNDAEASKSFRSEIKASVTEKWRLIDNLIHNMVHG